ncbi:MAG: hypothetical protein ABIC82_00630 [bacterium]
MPEIPTFEKKDAQNYEEVDRYELLGLLTEGDNRYLEYSTETSSDGENVAHTQFNQ